MGKLTNNRFYLRMKVDFLVVGHGLAGSILSYRLKQAGKKVLILDQPSKNQSSRVAAGLYNPITGRKLVKTWMADYLFPEIKPLYKALELETGRQFLRETQIYRPFLSIEQQNEWMGKSAEPTFQPYIEELHQKSIHSGIKDPYGGVMLKNCGWLAIVDFLKAMELYHGEDLLKEEFDEDLLERKANGWSYKNLDFEALIFCSGLGAMKSRFFDWLPFAPVKGEILELKQNYEPDFIVNRGVFRVSLGNNLFRVGSTYTKHDLDLGPTEEGKNELIRRLSDLISESAEELISHKYGIRPATKDRKPFIGKHPAEEGVYSFNGFGAKGVSLIPYFSKVMSQHLLEGGKLEKEVDVARYFNYI